MIIAILEPPSNNSSRNMLFLCLFDSAPAVPQWKENQNPKPFYPHASPMRAAMILFRVHSRVLKVSNNSGIPLTPKWKFCEAFKRDRSGWNRW